MHLTVGPGREAFVAAFNSEATLFNISDHDGQRCLIDGDYDNSKGELWLLITYNNNSSPQTSMMISAERSLQKDHLVTQLLSL